MKPVSVIETVWEAIKYQYKTFSIKLIRKINRIYQLYEKLTCLCEPGYFETKVLKI